MATVFDAQFAATGFPLLLSQFGESITYLPYGGGARVISAIIDREPPAIFNPSGDAVLPKFVLRVRNSCKTGIASNEIDTGKDELEFIKQIGEAVPTRFSIAQMVSQDSGVTQIAVM